MRTAARITRRPTTRAALIVLLAATAWAVSACDDRISAPCKGLPNRAIIISVRDSVTGAAAADGAVGTVETAGIVDSLQHADSLSLFGGSRLGTYEVSIQKDGYQPWSASNVEVTGIGACGLVVSVRLTAKLQPLAP